MERINWEVSWYSKTKKKECPEFGLVNEGSSNSGTPELPRKSCQDTAAVRNTVVELKRVGW